MFIIEVPLRRTFENSEFSIAGNPFSLWKFVHGPLRPIFLTIFGPG